MIQKNKEKKFDSYNDYWWLYEQKSIINIFLQKIIIDLICEKFPKKLKKKILGIIIILGLVLYRIFTIFNQLNLNTQLIQGVEKYSGAKISIIYSGKQSYLNYFLDIILSQEIANKKIGNISINRINKKIFKISNEIDLVIIQSDNYHSKKLNKNGYILVPEWISQVIKIKTNFNSIIRNLSTSAKNDIRKIKLNNFSYEITNELDKLDLFYYHMYVPYTRWKYGNSAQCVNYATIRILFEKDNKLMLIKKNNEYVYGALFQVFDTKILATYAGAMDEKYEFLNKGSSAAAYYFLIKWAKDNGYKMIDFGKCRPLLKDGLFRYKLKWNTVIKKSSSPYDSLFALKILKNNEATRSFLQSNPFIYQYKKKLYAKFFNDIKENEIKQFIKLNDIRGLEKIEIIKPSKFIEENIC